MQIDAFEIIIAKEVLKIDNFFTSFYHVGSFNPAIEIRPTKSFDSLYLVKILLNSNLWIEYDELLYRIRGIADDTKKSDELYELHQEMLSVVSGDAKLQEEWVHIFVFV